MSWRVRTKAWAWRMKEPFAIARGVQEEQASLQVWVTDDAGNVGTGEACGIPYQGETPETMQSQIDRIASEITAGPTRQDLLDLLPAGGARFALDSALWDLAAKRDGLDPFAAAGVAARPVAVDVTIGIRAVEAYETAARAHATYPVLKLKVDASDPLGCIASARRGAPSSRFIVDPNQSWTVDMVASLDARLAELGVVLLEQPIPIGAEAGLDGLTPAVPLCADELVDTTADLDKAAGRFGYINIKLDKCGGLTAGLAFAEIAKTRGFGLMVGCMAGSSLAMAPAMVLAQHCDFVDLDGPLLQMTDHEHGFVYVDGIVARPHNPSLWG